jgi:5,10-methylene-tetrahydrofolate dehydrogenase/methenyl tetrahydrofolate cyclohydrolase
MTNLSTILEDKSLSASTTSFLKVDTGAISNIFRQEIKSRILQLKAQGVEAPLLVGLLANDDPAALQYAEWTGKAFQSDGLRYE